MGSKSIWTGYEKMPPEHYFLSPKLTIFYNVILAIELNYEKMYIKDVVDLYFLLGKLQWAPDPKSAV